MKYNQVLENKENINNNYQKIIFSKKVKIPVNYLTINEFRKNNEIKRRNNEQINKNTSNSFKNLKQINEITNNYNFENNYNNNLNTEEDLDIELSSISKKIPINNFNDIEQINNMQNEKRLVQVRPKIKRTPSTNSFFDDIQNDNHNNITNYNIYNDISQQCSGFNLTNFGLENRPKINISNKKEKEVQNNNNFNNIQTNNINNIITNNNNNNNISFFNGENEFNIKRHNSVIKPDINKFLDINNETSFCNNNTNNNNYINNNNYTNINNNTNNNKNNNQYLYEEIQKLKKENKRLLLKNNELSLKLKAQETKTKTNINSNNVNQKKLSSQKEEFLLQKIKKLENEILKQKDIITKLTYNKRFNIGIRKIRVNSILIKGINNKLKRKNSYNLSYLYCNKINKKKIGSNETNLNKTLPNKFDKYIKKKSQNICSKKENSFLHIRPSYSSITSSPRNYNKENKNDLSIKNIKMNTTMTVYNKNNYIKLKLDNFDISKNFRKNVKIKESKINKFKFDKNKNDDKKIIDENNINFKKHNNNNVYTNNYKNKILGTHKTYGKTSLVMSVINDNLLGNLNLSQYMIDHNSNTNKELLKRMNLKRNSIY